MATFRNNYVLKFLSFISLIILFLNIVNQSIYVHSHVSENGEIVTHAHPFNQQEDNSPLKSHKHTSLEYVILNTLNIYLSSVFSLALLGLFILFLKKTFILKFINPQFYFHSKQNKSPPLEIAF